MPKNRGGGLEWKDQLGQLLESSNQPSGMKTQGTDRAWLRLHDTKVSMSATYTREHEMSQQEDTGSIQTHIPDGWMEGRTNRRVERRKGGRDRQMV